MNNPYQFRHITDNSNISGIKTLFNQVFKDEAVDRLAEITTLNMPALQSWYIYEDKEKVISALAQIEWNISMGGTPLKVWEQGIVGSLEEYRGQGLIRDLNKRLDEEAINLGVDMIIIQGIPDFYHKFSYRYAIELENHINLKLNDIQGESPNNLFRVATEDDIELLLEHDNKYRGDFFIRSHRNSKDWTYQFKYGIETEYSAEVLIFEELYFVKIQHDGFGEGLIVSELSENIPLEKLQIVLSHLKMLALEREKPYIRFNLPTTSRLTEKIKTLGGIIEDTYAWQVKILNPADFLEKIKPHLEVRLLDSKFSKYSGGFNMIINNICYQLKIENSTITEITTENLIEEVPGLTIPRDLFEPLILGHRSWRRLHDCRPDMFSHSKESGELADTLFPEESNWLYSIW